MINKTNMYRIIMVSMLGITISTIEAATWRQLRDAKNALMQDISDPQSSLNTLRERTQKIINELLERELEVQVDKGEERTREIRHIMRSAQSKEEYNEIVTIINNILKSAFAAKKMKLMQGSTLDNIFLGAASAERKKRMERSISDLEEEFFGR